MTSAKVTVFLFGLMVENILVPGKQENNTVLEHILAKKVYLSKVNGRMAARLDGLVAMKAKTIWARGWTDTS